VRRVGLSGLHHLQRQWSDCGERLMAIFRVEFYMSGHPHKISFRKEDKDIPSLYKDLLDSFKDKEWFIIYESAETESLLIRISEIVFVSAKREDS
jgi:hypothetical protein